MNVLPMDYRARCGRCGLPGSYAELERENNELKKENEELNAKFGRCVLKLTDYCNLKNKLRLELKETKLQIQQISKEKENALTKLKLFELKKYPEILTETRMKLEKVEKEKNRLVLELQKMKKEKSLQVYRDSESLSETSLKFEERNKEEQTLQKMLGDDSLKVDDSERLRELRLKLEQAEKVNATLLLRVQKLSEYKKKLITNLRSKAKVVKRFLYSQVQVIKYSDKQISGKVYRGYHEVCTKINECAAEQLNTSITLQQVQQACKDCKKTYENKIKELENEEINSRFLLQQQSIMLKNLKEDLAKQRKEFVKRGKVCKKIKIKEEEEMQLPPTPSTPGTADTSNTCQNLSPSEEWFNGVPGVCLQTAPDLGQLQTKSNFKGDMSIVSGRGCEDIVRIDHGRKNKSQQVFANNAPVKVVDRSPFKTALHKPIKGKTISLQPSTGDKSFPEEAKSVPIENVLTGLEHGGSFKIETSLPSLAVKSTVSKRMFGDQENISNDNCSYSMLPKSIEVPVIKNEFEVESSRNKMFNSKINCSLESKGTKCLVEPFESCDGKNDEPVVNDSDNSVIVPESLFPPNAFDNIGNLLSQLTEIPAVLSPMSDCMDNAEETAGDLQRQLTYNQTTVVNCNKRFNKFDSSTTHSKRRSIFSPTLRSETSSTISVESDGRADVLVTKSPVPDKTNIEATPQDSNEEGLTINISSEITREIKLESDGFGSNKFDSAFIRDETCTQKDNTVNNTQFEDENNPENKDPVITVSEKGTVIGVTEESFCQINNNLEKLSTPQESPNKISEEEGKVKPTTDSQLSFDDKNHVSTLIFNTPNSTTEVSKDVDSYLSSPRKKGKSNKLPREIRGLISKDSHFTLSQSKPSALVFSPISPPAVDHYELHSQLKIPKHLKFSDVAPKKNPLRKTKRTKVVLKRNKTKSKRSSAATRGKNVIPQSPDRCIHHSSPPRSPDSLKHYNMRSTVPGDRCSSSICLGTENIKMLKENQKFSGVIVPSRFEKSEALVDITTKVRPNKKEILSEMKVKCSEEVLKLHEINLKLTPQQRMEKLKEQENLKKLIKVNTNVKQNGSIEPRQKVPSNKRYFLRRKNQNDDKYLNEYKPSGLNNTFETLNHKLENDHTSGLSLTVLHPSQSQSDLISSTNGLLKIVDASFESTSTTSAGSDESQVEETEEPSSIKYCKENSCSYESLNLFENKTIKTFDVSPVPVMETTFSEDELLMEVDMSYKCLSYGSNLNDLPRKRKHGKDKETAVTKKALKLDILKTLNVHKRSRVNMKRITSLKKSKLESERKEFLSNVKRMIYKKYLNTSQVTKVRSVKGLNGRSVKGLNGRSVKGSIGRSVKGSIGRSVKGSNGSLCPKQSFDSSFSVRKNPNYMEFSTHKDCIIEDEKEVPLENCYEPNVIKTPDDYNVPEEDCLMIDIEKESTETYEEELILSVTRDKTHCASTSVKKMNSEGKSSTNISEYAKTSGIHIQQVSKPVCNLGNLSKLITGSTLKERKVLPSVSKSVLTPEDDNMGTAGDVYLPNFYTEHKDSPEAASLEEKGPESDGESHDTNLPQDNFVFQPIPLHEVIPQGEKIEVSESVLRTVVKKQKQDSAIFKKRNKLERRSLHINVPRKLTEKAMVIVEPILTHDLRSITDVVAVVDKLDGFEMRVVIKAVMLILARLSMKATTGDPQALWMVAHNLHLANQRSPLVHPRLQSLHLLFYMLIDRFTKEMSEEERRKFVEEKLFFIEFTLLKTTPEFAQARPSFWLNAGLIYTLLARHYQFMSRVQQLMYDMLYGFTKRALTVAFAMLNVWQGILPKRPIEFFSNNPLTLCIIRQLTCEPIEKVKWSRHMGHQLRDFMWRKYRFNVNTVDADKLFELCMARLQQPGTYEAAVLLAKRQPQTWFLHLPMQQLMNKVQSWWKGGEDCSDVEAVNAINILCSSLKPLESSEVHDELKKVLKLMQDILCDESTPMWMQEVIVLNICHLARLNFDLCLDAISYWKPSEISQEVVDRILNDIVCKRPYMWWNSGVGRSYLSSSHTL